MNVINIHSSAVTKLQELKNTRNLTNCELSALLRASPWNVGAWLKNQRAMSKKYQDMVDFLATVPEQTNLHLALAAKEFRDRIWRGAANQGSKELVSTYKDVTNTINQALIKNTCAVELDYIHTFINFFETLDDKSLADFNKQISELMYERTKIRLMSNREYAEQLCKDRVCPLIFEIDEDNLLATYYYDVSEDEEVMRCCENGDSLDDVYSEAYDQLKASIDAVGERLFSGTDFGETYNSQLLDKDTYLLMYSIPINHDRLKENIRVLTLRA